MQPVVKAKRKFLFAGVPFLAYVLQPIWSATASIFCVYRKEDISNLLFPGALGVHGRFYLDDHLKKDQSPYKATNSSIYLRLILEKPLLVKASIELVNQTVQDFIPKRVIPSSLLQEKKSQKADEDYRLEIQTIAVKLIDEYRTALTSGGHPNTEESLLELNSINPSEESAV